MNFIMLDTYLLEPFSLEYPRASEKGTIDF